ncbi:hypothetical protein SAMN04515668_4730 [Hymenobacter arizonensis]|uniref:Uncharacterized protein n=1 Tax=Hymenobacter arizonensis TaxID=1227077 RepID=A0A1I6BMB2_HYMAR|nr:hypothetical protein SAMN04515668_4730 [Hymenobacter arizonensis]
MPNKYNIFSGSYLLSISSILDILIIARIRLMRAKTHYSAQ